MKKDLRVIYLNNDDLVKYGFGSVYHVAAIDGPTSLIQKIVYYLLTEVGSNYFSPTLGSAFASLDRINWSPDNESIIKASITNAVLDIENKIKLSQILQTLTPEESLNKLEITSIEHDIATYAWKLTINVTNLLNQTFTVTL